MIPSPLTYKIISYPEIPNFNTDDCIDWAIEMLMLEYSSDSLLILAGLSKPSNYFEVIDYLKKALYELNFTEKHGEDAIICYSSYYIDRISKFENVEHNLEMVYKFCQSKDYEKSIFDFYLLYWAWDDIKYGLEVNSYWPQANKNNIENIIVEKARNWILENESFLIL